MRTGSTCICRFWLNIFSGTKFWNIDLSYWDTPYKR